MVIKSLSDILNARIPEEMTAGYFVYLRMNAERTIRVAMLDLYEGVANQGMRCLRTLLREFSTQHGIDLVWQEFDVRRENAVPDLSFDIYISSGGPGSPLETGNWGDTYFNWIQQLELHNAQGGGKHVLFICHSFQLACRYFKVAEVMRRKSTAFGVFPIHMQEAGLHEPVFAGLPDPFYAVDSRDFQVIRPDDGQLEATGATILAIEKERPHIPLERAIMAIRFNEYMIGTQFHPEADATGMSMYLQTEERKKVVIAEHGEEKWRSMIEQLNDPDKISFTYAHVVPNFLQQAVNRLLHVTAD